MHEREETKSTHSHTTQIIEVLKKDEKYTQLVEIVKKEIENTKAQITLSDKYKRACEVIRHVLTEEEIASIEEQIKHHSTAQQDTQE